MAILAPGRPTREYAASQTPLSCGNRTEPVHPLCIERNPPLSFAPQHATISCCPTHPVPHRALSQKRARNTSSITLQTYEKLCSATSEYKYCNITKIFSATLKNMCCNMKKYALQQRKLCTTTSKNMYYNIEKHVLQYRKNMYCNIKKMCSIMKIM
jgi:hypothetical protein